MPTANAQEYWLIVGLRRTNTINCLKECFRPYCLQHVEHQEEIPRPAEDQIGSEIASAARGCCGERDFSFRDYVFVLCDVFCGGDYQKCIRRTCRGGGRQLIFTTVMEISDAGQRFTISGRQLCCISRGNFFSLLLFFLSSRNAAGLDRQPEAEQPVQNSTRKEASGRIL